MERQVIIDKAPDVTTNGMMNLTEKELVTKANLAIKMMNDDSMLRGTTFVGATKLRNGGTILQLNSKDAADWLRGEDTANTFIGQLGGTSTMKTRPLNTVVEFIPITFNPDAFGTFGEVEKASGLPRGSIVSARYFKPPHCRTPQQKNAHAIFGFTTREVANHVIEHGIFVESKQVSVRKLNQEPKRCVKCQQVGGNHVAAECKSIHDTCARCGEMHKTDDYMETDPSQFKCTNCKGDKAKGHGAADRRCPHFLEKLAQIQARNPENRYRFYPTSDPKTWESAEHPNQHLNNEDTTWPDRNQRQGGWMQENGNGRGQGRLAGGAPGTGGGGGRERCRDEGWNGHLVGREANNEGNENGDTEWWRNGPARGGGNSRGRGRGGRIPRRGYIRGDGRELWPTSQRDQCQLTLAESFQHRANLLEGRGSHADGTHTGSATQREMAQEQNGTQEGHGDTDRTTSRSWADEVEEARNTRRTIAADEHNPGQAEDDLYA
jgi:hypothetical protein